MTAYETTTDRTLAAVRLVNQFCNGGSYLWGALAGASNRKRRQQVLETLWGRKVKSNECGYTVLMAALWDAVDAAPGECHAAREHAYHEISRKMLGL